MHIPNGWVLDYRILKFCESLPCIDDLTLCEQVLLLSLDRKNGDFHIHHKTLKKLITGAAVMALYFSDSIDTVNRHIVITDKTPVHDPFINHIFKEIKRVVVENTEATTVNDCIHSVEYPIADLVDRLQAKGLCIINQKKFLHGLCKVEQTQITHAGRVAFDKLVHCVHLFLNFCQENKLNVESQLQYCYKQEKTEIASYAKIVCLTSLFLLMYPSFVEN